MSWYIFIIFKPHFDDFLAHNIHNTVFFFLTSTKNSGNSDVFFSLSGLM